MSLILCIETSTEICSVALAYNGKTISLVQIETANAHASQLHLLVQQVLNKSGYAFKNLTAVCICKGPGSYTGLRVGVSAAKGYCYALNLPLIAIDSLSSLANHYLQNKSQLQDFLVVPMIDARRMEVYTAIFDKQLNMLEPITANIIEAGSFGILLNDHKLFFFGNGALKCKPILTHSNAVFIENITCSAAGLSMPAHQAYLNSHFENLAYFEPFYLKNFTGIKAK
ncbi:MAG: tRNA (adenosine(37)-N6)-threonylcarbamoyltransferase complex dimerization subunit type 1 TsaB [Bacteroidia bacterium]|nr:tRNA (adenosine(37)-N6)-threonylcarbamoyltransferase complex dimerization subunit type 1 TsaB [Bacteroidia bacterium]